MERVFSSQILLRGYNYYLEDNVSILKWNEDFIKSNVIGTYHYEVEIKFFNDEIKIMKCSCPYAEDGHNCKHMAAVLYKFIEEIDNNFYELENNDGNINKDKKLEIEKIVLATDKKKIYFFNISFGRK